MEKHLILLPACFLLMISSGVILAEEYFFRNYRVEDGLESNHIDAIIQDRKGFLWLATSTGLCKFDGKTSITYTARNGLSSNLVYRVYEDSKGNIWCGCKSGGISRFDGEEWINYDNQLPSTVGAILEDRNGDIWFGTHGSGIYRFNGIDWTKITENGMGDEFVRTILEDSKGNIWFGLQHRGVIIFDGKRWTRFHPPELGNKPHVNSIIEDDQDNIWLAGFGGKELDNFLVKISQTGHNIDFKVLSKNDGVPTGGDALIVQDGNNIWMATLGGGAGMFDGHNWKYFNTNNGLPSDLITGLAADSEGGIWFGTNDNGLARFSGAHFVTFTVDDGLPGNSIEPKLVDSKGNLWFNSRYVEGVTCYDGNNWKTFTADDGIGDNQVVDLFEDSRQQIWFCTGYSLIRFDGHTCKAYPKTHWVGSIIFEDDQGEFWLDEGYRFNGREFVRFSDTTRDIGKAKKMFNFKVSPQLLMIGSPDGLILLNGNQYRVLNKGMEFRAVIRDEDGSCWFATDSGLIHSETDDFLNFVNTGNTIPGKYYSPEDGLAHHNILALCRDKAGALWVGTNGGGVSRLSAGKITNFTMEDGLSSNVCYNIFEAENGLFFSMPNGLNRFDGSCFTIFTAENDGFFAYEKAVPLPDGKGCFWFSSPNGVLRYDPAEVKIQGSPSPVYITKCTVSGRNISLAGGFKLPHDRNNVKIDFVCVSLSAPEDVVYSYRLEGLETEWTRTSLNSVNYPYLPPGNFTFQVRAMNRSGAWSEEPARLSFQVLLPYWETNWFKAMALALVLGLGLGVHKVRTRLISKRNTELLREINERKIVEQALREKNEEVEHLKDKLQAENIYLQEEVDLTHEFKEIVGNSEAINKVLERVEKVASTDATVLILGETGTGKQLIAKAVHQLSPRAERPLLTINCATLPQNLIESELFGHERGAFTGALSRKIGRFEVANGGSLFLDEIGEMPLEMQAKLLRVIQEGEFERLGSSQTIRVNVRIIAATNRDLQKEIARGSFREDLYYRLNVYPIKCPALREHKEDIPLLVRHFAKFYSGKMGKHINSISKNVLESLMAYNWPGNVRELENIVERAVIVSSGNQLKLRDHLYNSEAMGISLLKPQVYTMEEFEREHILKVLDITRWKVRGGSGAAELLGMKPTTLESRMNKLGITRTEHNQRNNP